MNSHILQAAISASVSYTGKSAGHLVKWSIITSAYIFPASYFGSGPTNSIATICKGLSVTIDFIGVLCPGFDVVLNLAHS